MPERMKSHWESGSIFWYCHEPEMGQMHEPEMGQMQTIGLFELQCHLLRNEVFGQTQLSARGIKLV